MKKLLTITIIAFALSVKVSAQTSTKDTILKTKQDTAVKYVPAPELRDTIEAGIEYLADDGNVKWTIVKIIRKGYVRAVTQKDPKTGKEQAGYQFIQAPTYEKYIDKKTNKEIKRVIRIIQ